MAAAGDKSVYQIESKLQVDPALGTLARDTQRVFNQINPVTYRRVRAFYTEPMVLGIFKEAPLCIELARVTQVVGAEEPVRCGGLCHFNYKPKAGGAIITNIDGLTTVPTPVQYDFVFRVTFEASDHG